MSINPTIGTRINNFLLQHITQIPELGNLTVLQFIHTPTRALYVHCHRVSDTLNTFSISFKTPVLTSTGIPHILEHVTLCGSQKFPVKDPFFRMLNRSLSPYMNAWTASDHTSYPFVVLSEYQKDWDNLKSIYWDAVFRPLLNKVDFEQEGWRIEQTSAPKFGGVVFNEMKGALSDGDTVMSINQSRILLEGTAASVISGGDPLEIPTLQYGDLLKFHKSHYQPSNCLIISCGDRDIGQDLKNMDELLLLELPLKQEKDKEVELSVGQLVEFGEPKNVVISGPVDPHGSFTRYSKSFYTGESETYKDFVLSLMSHLMLDGPAAPFYQALMESGLASAYTSGTGFDNHTRWTNFSIGVQGISDQKRVSNTIDDVIRKVALDGFPQDRIDSTLESLELSLRHQPIMFGLQLVSKLTSFWSRQSSRPIASCLQFGNLLSTFREAYYKKTPNIFQSLCKEHLIENKHVLSLIQVPDLEYFQKRLQKEQELLFKTSTLPLTQNTVPSKQLFTSNNDEELLPTLTEADIPTTITNPSIKPSTTLGKNIYYRQTPLTNGITYFKALFPMNHLEAHEVQLVPLLCDLLTEMGTKKMSAADFSDTIKRHTGGISFSPLVTSSGSLLIQVASHCLSNDTKMSKMFSLVLQCLQSTKLDDVSRLKTIVLELLSELNNGISDSGSLYAKYSACASLGFVHTLKESIGGLTYLDFVKSISNFEELSRNLDILLQKIVFLDRIALISDQELSTENDGKEQGILERHLATFQSNFGHSSPQTSPNLSPIPISDSIILPSLDTNFVASVRLLPFTPSIKQVAALCLLTRMIRSEYLHPLIREQGGAYGTDSQYDINGHVFSCTTYRDPNPINSLEHIDRLSLETFLNTQPILNLVLLRKARLSYFSSIDSPKPIYLQGLQEFNYTGLSDDERQNLKHEIMNCTIDDIQSIFKLLSTIKPSTFILKAFE